MREEDEREADGGVHKARAVRQLAASDGGCDRRGKRDGPAHLRWLRRRVGARQRRAQPHRLDFQTPIQRARVQLTGSTTDDLAPVEYAITVGRFGFTTSVAGGSLAATISKSMPAPVTPANANLARGTSQSVPKAARVRYKANLRGGWRPAV